MKKAQHNLVVVTKALPKFSCYLFAPASMTGTPTPGNFSSVGGQTGELAEILQACDGPAGPGGRWDWRQAWTKESPLD